MPAPIDASALRAVDGDVRADTDALRAWLDAHPRVFVLTGAGVSTASGIPDYRDAEGAWKRTGPARFP